MIMVSNAVNFPLFVMQLPIVQITHASEDANEVDFSAAPNKHEHDLVLYPLFLAIDIWHDDQARHRL
jgi:hypothetical protein